MEAFLWTLLTAAISALTWVAYKHPAAYAKNFFPLLLITPTFLMTIWTLAVIALGGQDARELLLGLETSDDIKIGVYGRSLAEKMIGVGRGLLFYAAYAGLLVVLRFLPDMLDAGERRERPEK
jgi:hypothetical protein